ncbi:hypothetical protein [uncultured Fibrobacter sp.]|uniref:hypothetical protein n=1 Tax=uncultured Fibrobacter sp. TaxID=261512 RepID=UPI0025DB0DE7|nr:hypothetical protein [uncultured Fibrobacter sp.]
MKLSILTTLAISATILMGCASVKKPSVEIANHDSDHNIPAIDQMIVEMKQAYIEKCYLPVAHRKPPENACQSELFQTLERRYHLDFNQNHVAMASNDLFFKDIDAELRKMLRSDPEIRQAARNGGFKNVGEMLAYYKDKYKFDTQLEQF